MTAREMFPDLAELEVNMDSAEITMALDEIDRLRALEGDAALGREIRYEIEKWGDPYLMGVRARVSAGDGFTQNDPELTP